MRSQQWAAEDAIHRFWGSGGILKVGFRRGGEADLSLQSVQRQVSRQSGVALPRPHAVAGGLVNRAYRAGAWFVKVYAPEVVAASTTIPSVRLQASLAGRGVAVPPVALTRTGDPFVVCDGRVIAVMAWISGVPLQAAALTPVEARQAGQLWARFHEAAAGCLDPTKPGPPAWSAAAVMDHGSAIGRQAQAVRPETAFDQEVARTAAWVASLRSDARESLAAARGTWGLSHRDVHGGNLLAAADQLYLIDFDNAGAGHYEVEIMTAWTLLAAGMALEPAWTAQGSELFAGYQEVRRLNTATRANLVPRYLRPLLRNSWPAAIRYQTGDVREEWTELVRLRGAALRWLWGHQEALAAAVARP